jgi:ATP-dependent Lhr-like helicase
VSAVDAFGPATRHWFEAAFAGATPVQEQAWPAIARGDHTLMLAPTGSGKTLAAFLWSIDQMSRLPADAEPGVRVLYISPLKALVYDIEKNLRAPLVGIGMAAQRLGVDLRPVHHAVRTGDTPQRERARFKRNPPEIFITTPESLYLVLTSQARDALRTVQTVLIDEIHTMAGTKRGAHLALSLERLSALCEHDPQRVGISATQRPLERIAGYLGGDRPVHIVDASGSPNLDLSVRAPALDMERPWATAVLPEGWQPRLELDVDDVDDVDGHGAPSTAPHGTAPVARGQDDKSIWPVLLPHLLQAILDHRTTILFCNSRLLCERLAQRINELAGEELVLAHHGSIAHARRTWIEEALKTGQLKGIVATSSLELGIDMGSVDLVLQVSSPGSVARGLQRVGRAGHGVGQRSTGIVFPRYRGDLLECAAVAQHMLAGRIEETTIPRNPLDVLCQQIVATVAIQDWSVTALRDMFRRAVSFKDLSDDAFASVLDLLSGRYPSASFAELRPRVTWDRDTDTLTARRGSRQLAVLNAGTIPDRGSYGVFIAPDGPRIGELDEEMVYESRRGHTFILGASTWRIQEITRDRVLVTPAPGEPARMPFWRGQGPGRPVELGAALGAFSRELSEQPAETAQDWLTQATPLDDVAAHNLLAYVREQQEATGHVPSDSTIVIERFRDELGDWRVCILSPFGSRVHAPWALAIESLLQDLAGFEVQMLWTDDGIVVRFADADELPDLDLFLPEPEDVEDRVVRQLDRSALFASHFRENAARALLLPRQRPGKRTPLWAQRLRAQTLLAEVGRYPGFPILLETFRECLQDVFDLPALVTLLRRIQQRDVRVVQVETSEPSPFARSLVFAWVAAYLYEGDAPLAERRAQALTLDRAALRDLLGSEDLRELLDLEAVNQVIAELQGLAPDRQVRHADGVADLLRRIGHLTHDELVARCAEDPGAWLAELLGSRRVLDLRVAGARAYVAVEDASRYRDALGVMLPPGLASTWLEPQDQPLDDLVLRYARTNGPFTTAQVAARMGLLPAQVEPVLRALKPHLEHGELLPGGTEPEWCEKRVLRRLRRRTLAQLRSQIAAVDPTALGRFLPNWQGVGSSGRGAHRLAEIVDQLEGVAMPWAEVERRILPARMAGYGPELLDALGASGQVVWVGAGSLGPKSGKVRLLTRERVALMLDVPAIPEDLGPLQTLLMEHLRARGASFFMELQTAAGRPPADDLQHALWDLVWLGLITNDTFAPLRALAAPKRSVRGRGRRSGLRRRGPSLTAGGRWSLVEHLFLEDPSPTARAHARSLAMLERYGVVSREAALHEDNPGGFSPLYQVLRAMEESGQVRRGWFVEGLSGAQFALPGAVDRIRGGEDAPALVLSACDPANPWGGLLPWPAPMGEGRARRASGALVVLRNGDLVFWVGGSHLLSFTSDRDALPDAAAALARRAPKLMDKTLALDRVNGAAPGTGATERALLGAGFETDGKGLRLTVL